MLKAYVVRDIKTKKIEENVNEELNAIEEYNTYLEEQKKQKRERQVKVNDVKGMKEQVFVNPR